MDAKQADAGVDSGTPSKIISETTGDKTLAELTAMCDARKGFVEIHAACSGTNTCAGFSYTGGTLTEHTCNAVSGCAGMGCVIPAPGTGKQPLDILKAALPDTEGESMRSCNYCHAQWNDDFTDFDATKFTVHVLPGSTRTAQNWLDRSVDEQARIIAFGSHVQVGGIQLANMSGYYKMYSKDEIYALANYIRTLEPVIKVTELQDPVTFAPRVANRPGVGRARQLKK
jgi:hypothetical protein